MQSISSVARAENGQVTRRFVSAHARHRVETAAAQAVASLLQCPLKQLDALSAACVCACMHVCTPHVKFLIIHAMTPKEKRRQPGQLCRSKEGDDCSY